MLLIGLKPIAIQLVKVNIRSSTLMIIILAPTFIPEFCLKSQKQRVGMAPNGTLLASSLGDRSDRSTRLARPSVTSDLLTATATLCDEPLGPARSNSERCFLVPIPSR